MMGWLESILSEAVKMGTIYLLASLGEIYAERSGILNLGVEGIMAIGAASSFIFTLAYGHLAAIVMAIIVGIAFSIILAFMSVTLRLNQVVVGLAITILGLGVSGFMTHPNIRSKILLALNQKLPENILMIQEAPKLPELPIPILSSIPVIGKPLFSQNILVYIAYVSAFIMWFILFRTTIGLSLRSVGEDPAAADSLGINVFKIRYLATMIGGAFAGLSGAYLFIGFQPFWQEGLTAGRGFIALALVILAGWNPLRAVLGAYLFGGVETFQFRVQMMKFGAQAPQFILMFPYIVTIIVLIIISRESVRRRLGAPASLGIPYSRERPES